MKTLVIIPSRLSASRLPGKPLLKINGLSMISHVFKKAEEADIGEVVVAAEDQEIIEDVKKNGGNAILTSNQHKTGTDRIYEAFQKLNLRNIDYIINLQGDEPNINLNDLKHFKDLINKKNPEIATLASKIDEININNENIVKVITKNKISDNSASEALNFNRVIKKNSSGNIYHHFGIYLYKYSALKKFVNFEKSKNEIKERLEQLRAIDNNMKIDVLLANYFSSGIDTKKDLEEYINLLNK